MAWNQNKFHFLPWNRNQFLFSLSWNRNQFLFFFFALESESNYQLGDSILGPCDYRLNHHTLSVLKVGQFLKVVTGHVLENLSVRE